MFSVHTYLLKPNRAIGLELNIDHVNKDIILEKVDHSFVDICNENEVKHYFETYTKFFREAIVIKNRDTIIFNYTYYDLNLWISFCTLIEKFLLNNEKATEETVHFQANISIESKGIDKVLFTVTKRNKVQVEMELPRQEFLFSLVNGGLDYYTTMGRYGHKDESVTRMHTRFSKLVQQLEKC
ncbi:hypothetical protein [Brevibacillus porteri]|uniref:hypothetical protein n=2 Tax=Brevibacillus porteri TaxID=2126350 RepID=UPI00370BDA4B